MIGVCALLFSVCVCVCLATAGKRPGRSRLIVAAQLTLNSLCDSRRQLTVVVLVGRPVLPVIIVSPRQKSRQLCRSHDTTFGCSARVLSKPKKGLQLDRVNDHLDKGKTPLFQNNIKIQYPVFLMGGNEKGSCPLRRDKRD